MPHLHPLPRFLALSLLATGLMAAAAPAQTVCDHLTGPGIDEKVWGPWGDFDSVVDFAQFAVISPQNRLGVVLSNGIDCTIRKP